jgi:ribokinase
LLGRAKPARTSERRGADRAFPQRQRLDVRRGLRLLGARDVLLCSLEVPLEAVTEAASIAARRGALVIVNPAPLPAGGLPDELLSSVDLLTPNEHELAALIGRRNPTTLGKLGPHLTVVITRGARGIDLFKDGTYTKNAARPPAVEVVDTVGAGDCFSGALAAALARRRSDLEGALRFAVAASALSVTRPGAQSSMPRRLEIEKLIASEASAERAQRVPSGARGR